MEKKAPVRQRLFIEKVNNALTVAKGNVVFISNDTNRNIFDVKSKARMADTSEFEIKSYDEFLGFISGIISRDFDITNIFVDGIFKIVGSDNLDGFESFLNRLETMSQKFEITFVISVSIDAETAPDYIKKLA